MDINTQIIRRSWDQKTSGQKGRGENNISVGNFRMVNNLGPRQLRDKLTTGNKKKVSDYSEYIRYMSQLQSQKTW